VHPLDGVVYVTEDESDEKVTVETRKISIADLIS